ncbi:protein-L-isoaspartate(D-aspartate) O-methyltransferase [Desulfatitalea alkaliphila]|uniref:Protein-L-isoaspartate O-methyltransferase n=1 Tax=Desulfatitalea alkaliphila TaxID=2929485 RepID=A0AA41UQW8_9BACT|nr:protein-L-isoaspartate(D-aspartate) O-methyltransferase [Desulfatitalea alkaliphila]MCJ8501778.1 protein-L-isoaspartate(D-aspartate) O-methyltransferase [Desulfatitalea alkaliphila]
MRALVYILLVGTVAWGPSPVNAGEVEDGPWVVPAGSGRFGPSPVNAGEVEDPLTEQRHQMVEMQISARGVVDPAVLAAMERVPRHLFVPEGVRHLAYHDRPLPIGYDQTISQPYIVALMSALLELAPGQRVLEIGTGSGYQAAVLAAMDVAVYSIEIVPELGRQAAAALTEAGYDGVNVKIGDGYKGWPAHAPFDAIIVTCAPTRIPEPLQEQLAEGGRMVIPVGRSGGVQELVLLRRVEGRIAQQKIIDVRFVPMVDERGENY